MDMKNVPDDFHLQILKDRGVIPPVQPCGDHIGHCNPHHLLLSLEEDGVQKLRKAESVPRNRVDAAEMLSEMKMGRCPLGVVTQSYF